MSDDLKSYTFGQLLERVGRVRIPKIQRDYAQGRRNPRVDQIRKNFVHTLLLVVKGHRDSAELDFVYGSDNMGAFEPLDGQQRLTTLFLLHWMMGADLRRPDSPRRSVFSYETRNTSDEFCDELVQHQARALVDEGREKGRPVSCVIKGRDWFRWEWRHDPTVSSMLVMIDAVNDEMADAWDTVEPRTLRDNLDRVTFNQLDLGTFGLSNELFVKMNARGKHLSDFDILKSTLEEELQIQQRERRPDGQPLATPHDEARWRSLMDGPWIDLFWHKYARQAIAQNPADTQEGKLARLRAAQLAEAQLRKLLLRLTALQLLVDDRTAESLRTAAYNVDDSDLNGLLMAYGDSLTLLRSHEDHLQVPDTAVTIDFRRLMDDVNLLIYQDSDGTFYETSFLLPRDTHMTQGELSLFDNFTEVKVPNDVNLAFYAMLLFLRAFPPSRRDWVFDPDQHPAWLANYAQWARSTRNILLNVNTNAPIHKQPLAIEAAASLRAMAGDLQAFVAHNGLDVEADPAAVRRFMASRDKGYSRLDNQALFEEALKARLSLESPLWEKEIMEAESHPYLWGQVRALLEWAQGDAPRFASYSRRLRQLLDYANSSWRAQSRYYGALAAFMPKTWEGRLKLCAVVNKDIAYSLKRCLRARPADDDAFLKGQLRAFLDVWESQYGALAAGEFVEAMLKRGGSPQSQSQPWARCLALDPEIIGWAWDRVLFDVRGHVVLARLRTDQSRLYDPVLLYLQRRAAASGDKTAVYNDSQAQPPHTLQAGDKTLAWAPDEDGKYILTTPGAPERLCTPAEALQLWDNAERGEQGVEAQPGPDA